jgi:RNA polymerase sigma-70 factor (ECF subfamily)
MKELYELYYIRLVYFGMKFIKDRQVVEDIVIDSFIKLHDKGYENPKYALFTTVRNGCLSDLRNDNRRREIINELFTEEYAEQQVIESGVIKLLMEAVDKLPVESKRVIKMFYFEDKTCVEIGALLGKLPDTIRSIKRFALHKLFKLI